MQKIFVVEDDDNIRELVLYALASSGLEAEGFADGAGFTAALRRMPPSLILLDIMLPDEDGISILKRLKNVESTKKIPVVMLTARGTEYDRIRGLDLGADDYITKPFSVLELISRIKAVLRRCESDYQLQVIATGGILLNKDKRTVLADGAEIGLTFKEFELLQYLMINEGLVLTREKLMEQVWGFDFEGESRTLDMHIKSLRKKLGTAGNEIKTVRNVGYKIGD